MIEDIPPIGSPAGSEWKFDPITASEVLTIALGSDWGNRTHAERQAAIYQFKRDNPQFEPGRLLMLSLYAHGLEWA